MHSYGNDDYEYQSTCAGVYQGHLFKTSCTDKRQQSGGTAAWRLQRPAGDHPFRSQLRPTSVVERPFLARLDPNSRAGRAVHQQFLSRHRHNSDGLTGPSLVIRATNSFSSALYNEASWAWSRGG